MLIETRTDARPLTPRPSTRSHLSFDESFRAQPAPIELGSRLASPRALLIVATRFPPVASVGAIRLSKFVKYLGRFGWHCVVITGAAGRSAGTNEQAQRAVDSSGLRDIPPDAVVHRLARSIDSWPATFARLCAGSLGRLTHPFGIGPRHWRTALKWRFQRVHDRFAFPDSNIWRLPALVRLARKLDCEHRFDAILTSGMPFSDHIAGLCLNAVLGRPWLADFRDPWVEYIHWPQWRSDLTRRLTSLAECAVLTRADRVLTVNDQMTRRFAVRYGDGIGRKCVTIPNGFDEDDFPSAPEARPASARFRILYAGSLYGARSPEMVLRAFRQFLADTPGSRNRVQFDFAGRAGPFTAMLESIRTDCPVRYLGFLSQADALRQMAEADVNVILLPNQPGSENDTTAKLYECLGSRRAILAAVPLGGAAAQTLHGHEGVWLQAPDDVAGIAAALHDLYNRWRAAALDHFDRPLESFTRRHQAKRLADQLNEVVEIPVGRLS